MKGVLFIRHNTISYCIYLVFMKQAPNKTINSGVNTVHPVVVAPVFIVSI